MSLLKIDQLAIKDLRKITERLITTTKNKRGNKRKYSMCTLSLTISKINDLKQICQAKKRTITKRVSFSQICSIL